jgi:hypothetical protein
LGVLLTDPSGSCAPEKSLGLYSFCGELEGLRKPRLAGGDRGEEKKDAMRRAKRVSREEYVRALRGGKSGEGGTPFGDRLPGRSSHR